MSTYVERFLSYMTNYYVIKPINQDSSWFKKRNYILCIFILILSKLSISCIFHNRYVDDWLGDYMWIYGKAGFLIQMYIIDESLLVIIFSLSIRHFEDSIFLRNMIENIPGNSMKYMYLFICYFCQKCLNA